MICTSLRTFDNTQKTHGKKVRSKEFQWKGKVAPRPVEISTNMNLVMHSRNPILYTTKNLSTMNNTTIGVKIQLKSQKGLNVTKNPNKSRFNLLLVKKMGLSMYSRDNFNGIDDSY